MKTKVMGIKVVMLTVTVMTVMAWRSGMEFQQKKL